MSVVETITFRLAAGVGEAAFIEADRRVQTEFAYQQPGLVRRTTARGADADWLVLVLWASDGDADAAMHLAADDPATEAFMALVDAGSVQTERYVTLN
jgi:hypothetical protein